jgi:hypothetical protein
MGLRVYLTITLYVYLIKIGISGPLPPRFFILRLRFSGSASGAACLICRSSAFTQMSYSLFGTLLIRNLTLRRRQSFQFMTFAAMVYNVFDLFHIDSDLPEAFAILYRDGSRSYPSPCF